MMRRRGYSLECRAGATLAWPPPLFAMPEHAKPRRVFTRIEMLVVVTVVSTILSATVVLMHFVLEVDTEVRQRTHTVATVGRLAEQFRRDVHQARGAPLVAANHRAAEFHLSGGRTVKWQIDEPSGVIRTEQASDGAGHGVGILPAIRESSFSLPQGTTAALESQPQRLSHIVTIRIDSPGTSGPSLVIEALASRDQRLAAEEEKP